jgi:hypothetical protein
MLTILGLPVRCSLLKIISKLSLLIKAEARLITYICTMNHHKFYE